MKMPDTNSSNPEVYSSWVGLIFIFNLIVGTGALTLPSVFSKTGWLLSSILIIFLSFVSYMTVTFVIESMAIANAVMEMRRLHSHKIDGENDRIDETETDEADEYTSIVNSHRHRRRTYFSLNRPVEMGEMAGLFFNKSGRALFYVSLCVYLYGDLSIYATAISKSMSDMLCPNKFDNNSHHISEEFNIRCFNDRLAKLDLYRICVLTFALLVCPFSYFNVQKTKYFQLATTTMRWCAFSIIIVLVSIRIAHETQHPPIANLHNFPALIGASVYSFMCHHSIPGIVAPFNNKQHVMRQFAFDYGLICTFYLLLALTGVFAFKELNDLYTLNFVPSSGETPTVAMEMILYFLGMFPIFTLSTSFPIIAITLQNNLKALFLDPLSMERYTFFVRRLLFPTVAIAPPILIAVSTHNLGRLVTFTGAYGGACIEYVVPAMLVHQARKLCKREISASARNKFASIFHGQYSVYFVLSWSAICIVLVTINLVAN